MKKIAKLLLVFCMFLGVLGFTGETLAATNKEIPTEDFVTGGQLTDLNGVVKEWFGYYDALLVRYDFNFADAYEVNSGDTLTIQLPNELSVGNMTFDLKATDALNEEATIGTATVNKTDKTITITFNDYFEAKTGRSGYFYIGAYWDRDVIDELTKYELQFVKDGETQTVNVGKKSTVDRNEMLAKWGSQDSEDPTIINWTARINVAGADIPNAVFVDDIMDNHELIAGLEGNTYVRVDIGKIDWDEKNNPTETMLGYYTSSTTPERFTFHANNKGFTVELGDLIRGASTALPDSAIATDENRLEAKQTGLSLYVRYKTRITEEHPDGMYLNKGTLQGTGYEDESHIVFEPKLIHGGAGIGTATTTVKVLKEWEHLGNTVQPTSIEVELYQSVDGSQPTKVTGKNPVTLSATNNWYGEWTKLPLADTNGKEITYSVKEVEVPAGYTSETITNSYNDFTIRNTYIPKTSVHVEKVWEGDATHSVLRPTSVDVVLIKTVNGQNEEYKTVTLTSDTNGKWQHTWVDLPVYEGNETIVYTVEERNLTSLYTGVVTKNSENDFTITNTFVMPKTSFTVNKAWFQDAVGNRPASIEVELYTTDGAKETIIDTVTLYATSGWTYTWTDLDYYINGKDAAYFVREKTVPTNYTSEVVEDSKNNWTINNTFDMPKTSVSVNKEWVGGVEGNRPTSIDVELIATVGTTSTVKDTVTLDKNINWEYTWTNLDALSGADEIVYTVREKTVPTNYTSKVTENNTNDFTITNTFVMPKTDVSVNKLWINDNDAVRPSSVQVQLITTINGQSTCSIPETLDKDNNWSFTWRDLPMLDGTDEITYTVEEVGVPAHYTDAVIINGPNDYTITNTFEMPKTDVTVDKEWINDYAAIRPDSVEVELVATVNGVESVVETVELDESVNWTKTWTNLDLLSGADAITYSVREINIPQYYTDAVITNGPNDYTITNTFEMPKIDVTVDKEWLNDYAAIRPDSVEVELVATINGVESVVETVELDESVNWTKTWTNLDLLSGADAITYSVREINVPQYYTDAVITNKSNDYTITNTFEMPKTSVTVDKKWSNDNASVRPDSVNVRLVMNKDGEITYSDIVILSESNKWTYTWNNLDVLALDKEIVYTVEEVDVPKNYTSSVTTNDTNDYTITNTYETPKEDPKPETPGTSNPSKAPEKELIINPSKSVDTGDTTSSTPLVAMVYLSGIAILSLLLRRRKKA
ncbi:LPXTG-motif cell wall-anchored protein [Breznakia blatticola]|uniref:LPXTG-motif cell wall-anchored protein n=1 Tax=Breznakia blatticola TaxID=1754012 RepID=A0A4R7ZQE2_9FIRM|nr:Cna B-type domain-containing protein [Breznakia blatticola]TDW19912.1 LPXTG-motif cell wall-anchored protein [Breznakia blatticola]